MGDWEERYKRDRDGMHELMRESREREEQYRALIDVFHLDPNTTHRSPTRKENLSTYRMEGGGMSAPVNILVRICVRRFGADWRRSDQLLVIEPGAQMTGGEVIEYQRRRLSVVDC